MLNQGTTTQQLWNYGLHPQSLELQLSKTILLIHRTCLLYTSSTIESHGGFGNPTPLDDTFDFALNTILNGIRDLQGGTAQ